jgi:non-ribosomal peptide synthetase component F
MQARREAEWRIGCIRAACRLGRPRLQASATQAAGLTVGTLFHHQAVRNGGRTALESDGRSLTYAQLGERVNRLAHAFAAKGVGRGDRIAVLSENRLEYPELQLAAARLGAILACQNWRQSGRSSSTASRSWRRDWRWCPNATRTGSPRSTTASRRR